ncbi:MAG: prepilin peptidase [Gallionellales bacterium CG_4_9_14_0_8_um_filter_55_61]|nr:MAG: prepilin peptidase [Gallionellales bacterium CG_4_9_14_0_8_um_filter_55_61]
MTLLDLLQSSPPLFIVICTGMGLLVGSFLNVVIYRLPKMMERGWQQQCAALSGKPAAQPEPFNLVVPRSACPHCNHPISALENIPVISYLWLRGKCKACHVGISPRYPIIEAISGLLCGFAAYHFGFGLTAAAAMLLIWALLALAAIDLDTQFLPDDITLPLVWVGLIFNLNGAFTSLHDALLGAIFGYLVLWTVYWLFKLLTGKEGMGYGDFKLLAALGAWLGWQLLPLIILLSSLVGAVVGITLIVAVKHGRDIPIPFGPYLAGGGLIALFWGQTLTQSYLQLLAP